jgi:hypothetical protein
VNLGQIVHDFAQAMEAVDHRRPQAASHRDATRLYQPGIGPFGEDAAVAMTVAEMQAADTSTYADDEHETMAGGQESRQTLILRDA